MRTISRCKPLLGTYVEIHLSGEVTDDQLIEQSTRCYDAIEKVHESMSFHDPNSELSIINREARKRPCKLSPAMHKVLEQALILSELSEGVFDVTVAARLVADGVLPDPGIKFDPNACWRDIEINAGSIHFHKPLLIDLGGIAKGYAVDCATEKVSASISATINAGGDLRMTHWRDKKVNIKSSHAPSTIIEIPMKSSALATSACYYLDNTDSVIYKPGSPEPLSSSTSYSVFAESCMLADALTKIATINTSNAGALIRSLGAEAIAIDANNTISAV